MDYISTYVAPYAFLPQEIVASLNLPKAPPVPPCLEELDRYDKFGFPNPGTWLDQPVDWFADVEAAKRGKWRSQQKQRRAVDASRIFSDAPTGASL